MTQFFARDYSGAAFQLFGPSHFAALFVLFVLNIIIIHHRNADGKTREKIRWFLAGILVCNEFTWHVWNMVVGTWSIQTMLPLHLCSVLVWFGAIMLVTKNQQIYEFMYLLGIGGAIQALATPDLGIYGFPHFRFFQTFISHGLIVTSAIYMTVVEGFRPYWKSLLRVAIWINIYALIVYFINDTIGSNYLMINGKPGTPSILEILPPWPIYIIYMEVIGVFTMLVLYLPFAIQDRRNSNSKTNDVSN
jgi:hypothetical integral membrane protein (TIGR02206 family)